MILKGQNFRVLMKEADPVPTHCIAMATGCTVTLTGNTEDASHKDITGMASAPTIVSKAWTVQVDSLDVTNAALFLAAIHAGTPITLMWDETSTTDNQTIAGAAFARTGEAFISDVTLNFNNRENSAKSVQFVGTGELKKITTTPSPQVLPIQGLTKGQFVRLFLSSDNTAAPNAVIAAAMQLSFHLSVTLEDATTKDTTGDWVIQEPTAISYDISTTALVRSDETITSSTTGQNLASIEEIFEAGTPVKWAIANVSGANQRTKGTTIVSGSAIITQLTLNGPNRQNADYTAQFTGYGDYSTAA
ncbi:MAG: hypothetical protein IJ066_10865 [Bacteroidaceae bacterium]|nr:hypothetical protein [Bacteroidaceae bacterium]